MLDDNGVQAKLHFSSLHDALLNSILGDEAEHTHLLLLTDSVSTILVVEGQKKKNMLNFRTNTFSALSTQYTLYRVHRVYR